MTAPVNPFMANRHLAKIKAVQCFTSERYIDTTSVKVEEGMALPSSGESFESVSFTHSFKFDKQKACSVYQTDVTRNVVKGLDGGACMLFFYITCNLKHDEDVIELTLEKYRDFSGYTSVRTFYNAVNALSERAVIQRKKSNNYWVNPFIVFNGNRLNKFPDNVEVVYKMQLK